VHTVAVDAAFCARNCRPLNSSLIRKEGLLTGDYFAVSGNLSAAPNETVANHRRPT